MHLVTGYDSETHFVAQCLFLLLCFTAEMLATSPEMTLPGDGVAVVDEEREFVWDDYLEDTKSTAAPATSFKHVRGALLIISSRG